MSPDDLAERLAVIEAERERLQSGQFTAADYAAALARRAE
jgi:hypothetical protein